MRLRPGDLTMSRPATPRASLAIATLVGLLATTGCAGGAAPANAAERFATTTESQVDSYSIYDLGSSWRDQAGSVRTLDALRGRPRLLALVYTRCTSTCPLVVEDLKRIAAATDPRLGFVLVSLDPDRDDPHALAAFARRHELGSDRWTLLTGADSDVRALAASLSVRYRRVSLQEIAHSNTLTLLDSSGRVIHQQQGVGDLDATVIAAGALLH
jgi:protein SCO1/2